MTVQWIAKQMTCVAVIGALAFAARAHADSIVLKRHASLSADTEAIELGDIAVLDGPEAQQFAELAVADRPAEKQSELTITVQEVRAALDQAGAHWGRIDLNGWKTQVQLRVAAAEPPQAMTGVSIEIDAAQSSSRVKANPELVPAQQLTAQPTVRGVIARTLARQFRVAPADLRLEFDPRDREVLELSMQQYRIELEPMSALYSDTVRLQVRAWTNTEIAHRATVAIGVQVRTGVVVMAREVHRGRTIEHADITTKAMWLGAGELEDLMDADSAAGRIATQSLEAGDVLRERNARKETLIERGDIVQVRCLVGGVVITMQAEARADGSEGETIEFRKLGERQPFLARVVNRNEAVIELSR